MQIFKLEDVHQCSKGKRATRQGNGCQVKADPDPPGKIFAQVSGRTQAHVQTVSPHAQAQDGDYRQHVDKLWHDAQFMEQLSEHGYSSSPLMLAAASFSASSF